MVDYVIALIYKHNSKAKNLIDQVPLSNPNIELLAKNFGQEYNENQLKELKKDTTLFKLSWKEQYPTELGGKPTFYGMFISGKFESK